MTINGTSTAIDRPAPAAGRRVDWVDYAKGICIVMVVTMHSVLGVEAASGQTGFMHALVAFARPFRMPDFFLISGLFLSLVIAATGAPISIARWCTSPISIFYG